MAKITKEMLAVENTEAWGDLPEKAKELYWALAVMADDDGVVRLPYDRKTNSRAFARDVNLAHVIAKARLRKIREEN